MGHGKQNCFFQTLGLLNAAVLPSSNSKMGPKPVSVGNVSYYSEGR